MEKTLNGKDYVPYFTYLTLSYNVPRHVSHSSSILKLLR